MKNYSIFEGTMADMTYRKVEQAAKDEAVVLFPIAVIEEHGPHLPLATDTYLAYSMIKHVQNELINMNIGSVIAPPFYWGINITTNGFAGSFTVKEETMKSVLKDTIECLGSWGFKKVFLLNMHGDFWHCKTIMETAKEIYENDSISEVFNIIPQFFLERLGLSGEEPYVLYKKEERRNNKHPEYYDIHAGGPETSLMLLEFEDLVDKEKAMEQQSSKTTHELLKKWQQGGEIGREITPLGYCGNPSDINMGNAKNFIEKFSKNTAELIQDTI